MGGSGLPCLDGQLVLVGTLLTTAPPPGWEASLVPSPAWFPGECPPRPLLPPEETPNVCPCHEVGSCAVGPWMPASPPRQMARVAWVVGSRGRRPGPPGSGVVGGWPAWSPHRPLWAASPHPRRGRCLPSIPRYFACPGGQTPPHGCFLCSTQPAPAHRSSPLTSSLIQWICIYIFFLI